jgi:hypothetical protein
MCDDIEDFRNGKWPFGSEGKPEDVPAPSGAVFKTISKLLGQVGRRAGEYSVGGEADSLPAIPGLVLDGVGPISVPLNEQQARVLDDSALSTPALAKSVESAPKSWNIHPQSLQIQNPAWRSGVRNLVGGIATRLGYEGVSMECKLRKLLIHGEGGAFIHRSGAKMEDSVRATLMVQLPSVYEGGDLVVYRKGDEKTRHDLGKAQSKCAYLPHFVASCSDAEFELEKVTTGYRLVLVYEVGLPANLPQLEQVSKMPVSEDLAASIGQMEPDEGSFALLLTHDYTSKTIEELGVSALRGIDLARFRALQEANQFARDDTKLRFFIVELTHEINYDGDGYTWREDNRRNASTWYSTSGQKLGHTNYPGQKLNFLNPRMETLAELWLPRSKAVEEDYEKTTTSSGFAIVAWPAHQHYENALEFRLVDIAVEALVAKRPIEASALRAFWETVLKQRGEVWKAYLQHRCERPNMDVSVRFSQAFCELLLDAGDLSLVKTFLLDDCARLGGPNENETLAPVLTKIIRKFEWAAIESEVAGLVIKPPLRKSDHFPKADVEATLQVVDGVGKGDAQQNLLPLVVEKALALDTEELLSSRIMNLLWQVVVRFGDKNVFEKVASRCTQIEPSRLGPIVLAFEQCEGDLALTQAGLAVLQLVVSKRGEWLNDRIHALDQPFSWRMPDAEFPDAATVQTFLRGGNATMLLKQSAKKFKGLQSARNYAAKWTRASQINASFEMEASSTDGNAIVTVTKTRKWFLESQHKLQQYKEELAGVMKHFDSHVGVGVYKKARLE